MNSEKVSQQNSIRESEIKNDKAENALVEDQPQLTNDRDEKIQLQNGSVLKDSSSNNIKQNRRRAIGSHYIDPNQIQEMHKRNTSCRTSLKNFAISKSFDIFIIILVIIYTVLVFILFALDNDENKDDDTIQLVIDIVQYLEMAILGVFIFEIFMKVVIFGFKEYFKDSWLVFDAIVIFLSVLLLVLELTFDNDNFSTISKILRSVFRFLRLFLVFRKVNQFKKIAITHSRFSQKTPVEAILDIMNNLKENVDDPKYIQDLDYAIEMISDNRLYEPIVQKGDQDAENWIGTYAETKNKKNKQEKSKNNQTTTSSKDLNSQYGKSQEIIYNKLNISQDFLNYFEKVESLEFEVFDMHDKIQEYHLANLVVYLHQKYDICQKLKIDPKVLFDFSNRISDGYFPNHYHSKMHAFDITQTTHFFLTTCDFINIGNLSPLDMTTMYIAAACHDYEQGGLNNVYLINTRDQLAIRYNDKSPLENHHLSQTFFILKEQNNKYNFTANFSKENYKRFRERMISMVLATDMKNHFADQAKLKGRLAAEFDPKEKDKALCMETILHAADISNPIKPWKICENWSHRVLAEFWEQGDKERERGLAITYLCDRYTTNKSKSQIGFIDFIVKPYYETIKQFLPKLEPFLNNFEKNKENWKLKIAYYDDELAQLNKEKEESLKKKQDINIRVNK